MSCLDAHTANITSTVHHDGLFAAQDLIDLITADIQMRDPPIVNLSNGWILCTCFNASPIHGNNSNTTVTSFGNDENDNGSLGLSFLITISVASFCAIIALIFCITVGLVYIKHKKYVHMYVASYIMQYTCVLLYFDVGKQQPVVQ